MALSTLDAERDYAARLFGVHAIRVAAASADDDDGDALLLQCAFLEEPDEDEASNALLDHSEGGSGQLADDATLRVALVCVQEAPAAVARAGLERLYGADRLRGAGPLRRRARSRPERRRVAAAAPALRRRRRRERRARLQRAPAAREPAADPKGEERRAPELGARGPLRRAGQQKGDSTSLQRGGSRGAVDLQLRFVAYQLLRCLMAAHGAGVAFGGRVDSRSLFVSDRLWLRALPRVAAVAGEAAGDAPLCRPPLHRKPVVARWVDGSLSNFEYLVLLNEAAGRGNCLNNDHFVFPWVSDLKSRDGDDHWRDLSKTKFRLNKGDLMLDRTYGASRHHVPEPGLSELALCIYLARITPISVLRRVVRANFVAEHYPATVERLYAWTPDEAIPEFFCDPSVFKSRHGDRLRDLGVPGWCASPEDFVSYHRALLESDAVSSNLHAWIDVTFGYAFVGAAAVERKNAPLRERPRSLFDRVDHRAPGAAVLFAAPHPRRAVAPRAASTSARRRTAAVRRRRPAPSRPARARAARRRGAAGRRRPIAATAPPAASDDDDDARRRKPDYENAAPCLFPSHFAQAYDLVAAVERRRRDAADAVLGSLDAFGDLELAGALLCLPHYLACLDDTKGWSFLAGDESDDDDDEKRAGSSDDLCLFVDVVGAKIGQGAAAHALAPRVAAFVDAVVQLEGEAPATFLRYGDLVFRSVVDRCGARVFAKLFVPTLCDVARGAGDVAVAAAGALGRLASRDALGPALAARLVLPAVVADLGREQLHDDPALGDAPTPRVFAVVELCDALGAEAVAPAVLSPLLDGRGALAVLEGALSDPHNGAARRALLEIIRVLRSLVGALSPATVLHFYVDVPPVPLPRLLGALLPTTSTLTDAASVAAAKRALTDVASLVSLVCLAVGPAASTKHLLPEVDRFFGQLAHLRASAAALPGAVSELAERLALDVATELYTPLAATLGIETMRRHAPSARGLLGEALPGDDAARDRGRRGARRRRAPQARARLGPRPVREGSRLAHAHGGPPRRAPGAEPAAREHPDDVTADDEAFGRGSRSAEAAAPRVPPPPPPRHQTSPGERLGTKRPRAPAVSEGMELHRLRDARSAAAPAAARAPRPPKPAARSSRPLHAKVLTHSSSLRGDFDPRQSVDTYDGEPRADSSDDDDDDKPGDAPQKAKAPEPVVKGLQPQGANAAAIRDERLWLLGAYPRSTLVDERPWEASTSPGRRASPCRRGPGLGSADGCAARRGRRGAGRPARRGLAGARVLAVDAAETVVLCGGRDGLVRVWSLRRHPPELQAAATGRVLRPVRRAAGRARALHLRRRRRRRRPARGELRRRLFGRLGRGADEDDPAVGVAARVRRGAGRVAPGGAAGRALRGALPDAGSQLIVDAAPMPLGYGAGGATAASPGAASAQQLVVLAERALSIVDVRARDGAAAEWPLLFEGADDHGAPRSRAAIRGDDDALGGARRRPRRPARRWRSPTRA
ncbi:hypothetical protein JL721_2268 [Aureococcus anophagefferens]|nr:hypothetical protein JL721_2268 [Aureococcus anophagefferens]